MAVLHSWRTDCRETKPISRQGLVTAVPFMKTRPRVGGISPAATLSRVVFPHPLSPGAKTNPSSRTSEVNGIEGSYLPFSGEKGFGDPGTAGFWRARS